MNTGFATNLWAPSLMVATPMVQGMRHMGMGTPNSEAGLLYDP